MELKGYLERLEKHSEFKEWFNENKDCYFSYAMTVIEKNQQKEWHIGFYNPKDDKIATFLVDDERVSLMPEEEVFKKEDSKVNEINRKKMKLDLKEALAKATNLQKKEYAKELPVKIIVILQNLTEYGNIWNMTFITQQFNTLNVKLDASTGKVREHKLSSIFSFRQN